MTVQRLQMSDLEIVDAARRWIGTPYVHQASLLGAGADCLGLIRGVWREVVGPESVALPGYTSDWAEVSGIEPLLDGLGQALEPAADTLCDGQVLVFRMRENAAAKHAAILSNTHTNIPKIIHAYSGRGVIEAPLNAGWRRRIAGRFAFPKRRPSWQH